MKIALCTYHNPNFVNTNVYRKKAIQELKHELIVVEDRPYILPGRIRQKCKILQDLDFQHFNNKFIKTAKKERPDLWMVVGGDTVLSSTVKQIKDFGILTALWTTNVPEDFDVIKEAAPFYDYIFCAGTEAMNVLQAVGVEKLQFIPYGCDPDYHKPVELTQEDQDEYGRDVVFVGSFYPNRAHVLEKIADMNIGIWGPYWNKVGNESPLKDKVIDVKLNYDEWVKIYSAAKITVVIHFQDGKTPSHQVSPKLFEAMACGSFVLVDQQKDVQMLFEDGQELVFFKDKDDLRVKIQYYLEHERERRAIAERGRKVVIQSHTFKHRMEKMIEIIKHS